MLADRLISLTRLIIFCLLIISFDDHETKYLPVQVSNMAKKCEYNYYSTEYYNITTLPYDIVIQA